MGNVIYTPEGKSIIKAIDEMNSWERVEILEYLLRKHTYNEEYNQVLDNLDLMNQQDIDPVEMIIGEGLEEDVLCEMSSDDICDYLLHSMDDEESAGYMFRYMSADEQAKILTTLSEHELDRVIDSLKKTQPIYYMLLKRLVKESGKD